MRRWGERPRCSEPTDCYTRSLEHRKLLLSPSHLNARACWLNHSAPHVMLPLGPGGAPRLAAGPAAAQATTPSLLLSVPSKPFTTGAT